MSKGLAKELQEYLAKEAIDTLVWHGSEAQTEIFTESIRILGTAWKLSGEDTERLIELIEQEKQIVAAEKKVPDDPAHVLPLSELPKRVSGKETLENIWMLFETATMLENRAERVAMLNMARYLEEYENLLDWVNTTPEERQEALTAS